MALFKFVSGENPREIALQLLRQRDRGQFIENLLDQALAQSRLSQLDRKLCQELVYGVVRWQATLDWLIVRKTGGRVQKRVLQDLLRLGLYQIFWLERIPDHAAVHQTVEMARHAGFGPQSGFVNAVLRGYLREADGTRAALEELKKTEPHVGFSHPQWLVEKWQRRWGAEKARELMAWNNTPARTFARVNTLKVEASKLIEQWRDENVEYDFVLRPWLPEAVAFELKNYPPLHKVESFQQGLFYIQDPSTLLAVQELAPQPGQRVLDLCAAPGGKLTYIAQLMKNEGVIVAHDLDSARAALIQENCRRLGVTCVRISSGFDPATKRPQLTTDLLPNSFDCVLVDAPCSNTGVMRRRLDLRWRIKPEEIQRLRTTQIQLLESGLSFVKPGGTLVYSTCSLELEENEEVLTEIVKTRAVELVGKRELVPINDKVDGAFVAKLKSI